MVSSINYAITANIDSIECGTMQQRLLWMLYDRGHLRNYPMALGAFYSLYNWLMSVHLEYRYMQLPNPRGVGQVPFK